LAFAEDFWIDLGKRTMLDLVAEPNEELEISPGGRVIRLVVLLQTLLELPASRLTIDPVVPS